MSESGLSSKGEVIPWLLFFGKVIGTLVTGVLCLLYVYQDKLLYIPRPPGFPVTPEENPPGCISPNEWNVKGSLRINDSTSERIVFEDNLILTEDNQTIHTWLLLQNNPNDCPTLIYFHGNAANMGFRLQNAAEMFGRVGLNIMMMDYRGYGKKKIFSKNFIYFYEYEIDFRAKFWKSY
jgi:hypothetical protein